MAIGLPNWWHSFVLLGLSMPVGPTSVTDRESATRQLLPFGPPRPPPAPAAPPIESDLSVLPQPQIHPSFFNQTPPVPELYLVPFNHDRSVYMANPYAHRRYTLSNFQPPDPYSSMFETGTSFFSPPNVHHTLSSEVNELTDFDRDWENLYSAYPITGIIQHVLSNYKSHEGPDENNPDPTTVTVSVHILAITSINVVQMDYTVDLYLRQQWVDPRLAWDHVPHLSHYTDYVLLTAQKHKLWLPDLFFRNGKRGYRHDMSVPNDLIRVHPNGSILYSQKITMIFSCSMYLRLYPMDYQECQMNIGSYGYTLDELKFMWRDNDPVTVAENLQLLEFDSPRNASTRDCTKNGTTSTGTYSCLLLTLPLQRLVSSYLVTTYIPEVLIVMVSWLGFWIDVRAVPARISLGLLTLLGLLTEGSSVGSKLPRVTYVKAIDVWIIACLLFVVGALAEFAVAYMQAPREKNSESEQELRQLIRDILQNTVGDVRCCCCFTRCTNHKPILVTSPVGQDLRKSRTNGCDTMTLNNSGQPKSSGPNTLSSVAQCGLCESVQPNCCTCPLCIHLQCPKAPRSEKLQRRTMKISSTLKSSTVRPSVSSDRKHIVICEPPPKLHSQSGGRKRTATKIRNTASTSLPIKSALKSSQSRVQPPQYAGRSQRFGRLHMPNQFKLDSSYSCLAQKKKQHGSINRRSLFRFTPLHCVSQQSSTKRLRTTRLGQPDVSASVVTSGSVQSLDNYDSEVDAYSRFLFPACFVLFNCCYWLFYMVIVDDRPPEPS